MNNNSSTASKKYKIGSLFLVLLTGFTIWYISKQFELDKVLYQICISPHKGFLAAAAVMAFIYLYLFGRFIGVSLHTFGVKIPQLRCFVYGSADFFYSAITPSASGGQPVVIYLMGKDGYPFSQSAFTVILQTIFFKAVLLLYAIVAVFFIPDIMFGLGNLFGIFLILGTIITLIGLFLCLASMYRTKLIFKLGSSLINFLAKLHLIRHREAKIDSFNITLEEYKDAAIFAQGKWLKILRLFFITFLQRTSLFSVGYFVYRSFGLGSLGILEFLCIQAAVSLAVDSIPLPGAIGASEYASFLTYEKIFSGNETMAAASMLLTRGIGFYFTLIISSIFTLGYQFSSSIKAFSFHKRNKSDRS